MSSSKKAKARQVHCNFENLNQYVWTQKMKHPPNQPKSAITISSIPTIWSKEQEERKKNVSNNYMTMFLRHKCRPGNENNTKPSKTKRKEKIHQASSQVI